MLRRRAHTWTVALLAAAALLCSGCGIARGDKGPCDHVVVDNNGFYAAYDWDDEVHPYGDSAPFTACIGAGKTEAVVDAPAGIVVDPPTRALAPTPWTS